MKKTGFDERWIGWNISIVSPVSYRLVVDGNKTDEFRPSRGLAQEGHLSPSLFLLVAYALQVHHKCCCTGRHQRHTYEEIISRIFTFGICK